MWFADAHYSKLKIDSTLLGGFFTLAGTGGGHIGRRYHGQRLVGAAVCVTSRSTVLVTMAVLYVGQGAGEKLLTAWAGLFSFSIVAVTVFSALSLGDQ